MLDEPTAALGVAQSVRCSNLIIRLKDRGLGVVLISHNIADVMEGPIGHRAPHRQRVAAFDRRTRAATE